MTLQEYRIKLKKYHICRECKKTDAYTLAGRTYCFDCAEKMRKQKQQKRKDETFRLQEIENKKRQVERYKLDNRCIKCGKAISDDYFTCTECRLKQRKYRTRTPRGLNGICWQCNKRQAVEGKKLCESCLERKREIALKNLEKARQDNPWKGKFL